MGKITENITGNVSNTTHFSFNGTVENVTLLGGNIKVTPELNLSLSAGNFLTHTKDKNTNKPIFEAKLKYNIGKYLNTQARFREIGGDEQYRLTFGGSYKIDKRQSVYVTIHGTAKDSGEWKYNTGGWLGYTYQFKNGVSISGEFQQNIPLNKTTKSLGETLSCFDDSDKMFNVILAVPFK